MITSRLLTILAVCLLALPAHAQTRAFDDPVTGLHIELFGVYLATPLQTSKSTALTVVVIAPVDAPVEEPTCIVTVHAAPNNASMTQDQLNARTTSQHWLQLLTEAITSSFQIEQVQPFTQDGVAGVTLDLATSPGADMISSTSRLDTPNWTTTVTCPVRREGFASMRPTFELIRKAVTPP